jgi:transcriptional regulator with XRE-family HTH domain
MFADRLRELRIKRGLSQYAVAKRSGLTKQALSKLELGEREPNWETVQRLALALGVDCSAFVDAGLQLPPETEAPQRGRPPKAKEDVQAEQQAPAPKRSPKAAGGHADKTKRTGKRK